LFFLLPPFVLGQAVGLEVVAVLRAVVTLLAPAIQLTIVATLVMPPILVQLQGTQGHREFLRRSYWVGFGAAAAYLIVLSGAGSPLMVALYGEQYGKYAYLVPLVGLSILANAVIAVSGAAIRAREKPEIIFRASLGTAVLVLPLGIVVVHQWGVIGAALGMSAAYGLLMILQLRGLSRAGA
jgi:O-antigen/teichoic acid export membrane protein